MKRQQFLLLATTSSLPPIHKRKQSLTQHGRIAIHANHDDTTPYSRSQSTTAQLATIGLPRHKRNSCIETSCWTTQFAKKVKNIVVNILSEEDNQFSSGDVVSFVQNHCPFKSSTMRYRLDFTTTSNNQEESTHVRRKRSMYDTT